MVQQHLIIPYLISCTCCYLPYQQRICLWPGLSCTLLQCKLLPTQLCLFFSLTCDWFDGWQGHHSGDLWLGHLQPNTCYPKALSLLPLKPEEQSPLLHLSFHLSVVAFLVIPTHIFSSLFRLPLPSFHHSISHFSLPFSLPSVYDFLNVTVVSFLNPGSKGSMLWAINSSYHGKAGEVGGVGQPVQVSEDIYCSQK